MPFVATHTFFADHVIAEHNLERLVTDACKRAWVSMNGTTKEQLVLEDVGCVLVRVDSQTLNGSRLWSDRIAYKINFYYKDRGGEFNIKLRGALRNETLELIRPDLRSDYSVEINMYPSEHWSDSPNWVTKAKMSTGTTEDYDMPGLLKTSHRFDQNT